MTDPSTTHASSTPVPVALVDQHVRSRVSRRGLGETLFVEAGAGSGKTTQLVSRIVNLVLDGGASLASIAAITFTEAAARELQSRIRAEFERRQAVALDQQDTELAGLCSAAIAESDLAAITTLHGFANRILGEFAVAAGLPPQVSVLDEVSSQLATEDRWLRFVDRLYSNPEHVELLQVASVLGIRVQPTYDFQASMRLVAAEFSQNWDRLEDFIAQPPDPFRVHVDFGEFERAVDELRDVTQHCQDPDDNLLVHIQTLLPQMQSILDIDDPLRQIGALRAAPKWGRGRGGKKGSWVGVEVADVKSMIDGIEELKTETLGPLTDVVLSRLSRLVAEHVLEAAQARRRAGGLEFHDLLVLARDLLRTKPAARRALHDRFRHLLLDEFQDTDPIQIELAVLIATSADHVGPDSAWNDLPVEPGRLFFVGDPKQSIYRFRRADIALFLKAREQFGGLDGPLQLEANFRTVEPIVDWVNAFFSETMHHEPDRQPAYLPLAATRTAETAAARHLHLPVLLGGPAEDDKIRAGDLRTLEARDVAGIVQAILAEPQSWPVFDRSTDAWRPARLDDITILLPTRTSLPFLRSALEDADVHYRITTGTLVYGTQEVADALSALRAIDDPGDELSLVAALRSPLYGCSDVDLLRWRQAGGRWDVRSARPDAVDAHDQVAQAVSHLHSLWSDRWFMTPSALLERLLRERQAPLLAFGDPRPVDVWRRLRFLVEQARAFEEANAGDLRAFVEWAALQSGDMARVHEPLLPETDQQALSIQTIHGSKGLEFPITILSGMTTQFRSPQRGVSVLWSPENVPQVRIRKDVETHDHALLADVEAAMDEHEKLRLAYVATTRARDHLIVSCHHKPGNTAEKTYGGRFWSVFEQDELADRARGFDWEQVVDRTEMPDPGPSQLGLALDDRDTWIAERRALLEPARQPSVLSATGVARAALEVEAETAHSGSPGDAGGSPDGLAPYRNEHLADQDDDLADQPLDPPIPRRRGRIGNAIGSAVHGVLQLLDLGAPVTTTDSTIDVLVGEQCELFSIPDSTEIVRRLVQSALESDAMALAATHPHHKELFVAAPVGERTIEGYVDLLIETPQGLIVVDYKTDNVRSPADVDAKLETYTLQAAAYAVALQASTAMTVAECRFVFLNGSGAIERTVPELAKAMDLVRETVAASAPSPLPAQASTPPSD